MPVVAVLPVVAGVDVAGVVTTAACPAFAYKAERSANCVRRVDSARWRNFSV